RGPARKPDCDSFVDEIVNDILADKRPDHAIDGLLTPLVALEFLKRFAIAQGHDYSEIEGLFHPGPIHQQGAADAHVIYAAGTAECAQGTQEKILIINIARTFQPKQHHTRDLAGADSDSLCPSRRERERDAGQNQRDANTQEE